MGHIFRVNLNNGSVSESEIYEYAFSGNMYQDPENKLDGSKVELGLRLKEYNTNYQWSLMPVAYLWSLVTK